jgi:uncharacterized membrane protein
MRTWTSIVLAAAVVAFVGCNKSEPGGPGATHPGSTNPVNKNQEFKFDKGLLNSLSLKQGEKKDYDITIDRGSDFKQAVKIKIDAPTGIMVDKKEGEIKPSDKELKVSIAATDDAPLGDHKVTITGTPETGDATHYELTVKVSKK